MRPFLPHPQAFRALQLSISQPAPISRGASSRLYSQLARHNTLRPSPSTYLQRRNRPLAQCPAIRHKSDTSTPENPLTDRVANDSEDAENKERNQLRREQEPSYQITFTCKPCGERSSHRMSKHGYHRGTVLIQCPSCSNRHVISDHLKIFMDEKGTLEDILEKEGQKVTRVHINGEMEFWDEGTVTKEENEGTKS